VAENASVEMKPTLGLTGLTMNAMALIAPGAFLWLTFAGQAAYGATTPSMWIGIVFALLLCLATAICYAEMAKLYPGTGSSYYFAEQAFLNHDKAWPYARLAKFVVGWGSHLYYWVYPGVMVGVIGVICGYLAGTLWPNFMSATNPGPAFMMAAAIVSSFAIAYIAHRGITGSTIVNFAINAIQIGALIVFAIMALSYRMSHPPGSIAYQFDPQTSSAFSCEFAATKTLVSGQMTDTIVRTADGIPVCASDAAGKPVPYHVSYPESDSTGGFLSHSNARSVVRMHNFGWMFVQATIAILILVGFESVTSMGGEARNAKRDVPIAVITSLLVQGAFCYLFEYFAANYFLSSGYTMQNAAASAAPIGDMMVMVGDAILGAGRGRIFMLCEAATVFLALIGTTLSCINTGARVTYAMGKDQEAPESFGILHSKNLTPHRAIWTLAVISAVIGCITVAVYFGDGAAPADSAIQALPHGFWSSWGYTTHDKMAALPNTFLMVSLASNFGTFLLYMLSCVTCIVCYHKHPKFSAIRHLVIPAFGFVANLACMAFYLIGPFMGYGTKKEPLLALGVAMAWGGYGWLYFALSSKKNKRTTTLHGRESIA
jgi:APA family basic amino acid/polyamine antiporter